MSRKSIKICSRNYRLRFNKKKTGASFKTYSDAGCGEIEIGTKFKDTEEVAERVVHECVEAILAMDDRRFLNYTNSHEGPNFIFHFDHDYLGGFAYKLIDALISSGFFKIVDGRK